MRKVVFYVLFLVTIGSLSAQSIGKDSQTNKLHWNHGFTLSPQMLFVGGLDLGVFSNIEYKPFSNAISTLVGVDIRNKWIQLDLSNSGLDTRSMKSHYNLHLLTYAGLGVTLPTQKKEKNSLYITITPYLFAFKESAETDFINNTVNHRSINLNAGITWINSKRTKKGRTLTSQFYLPIIGTHFLDELRTMNLKVGLSI